MTPTLYKVLGAQGEALQGSGTWHLPNGRRRGKWMPVIEHPRCCRQGYHLIELSALPEWLRSDCTIYVAEGRGASHTDGSGKTAFAQARLVRQLHIDERELRLFAADCAEHVLPIFYAVLPGDERPQQAIDVARAFARGECSRVAAAGAAAASSRASSEAVTAEAVTAEAQDAAWAAACAAAWAADTWVAEAWAAAWGAAWAAAWAAERAVRAAAGEAEEAWAAERQWQADKLSTYLRDEP